MKILHLFCKSCTNLWTNLSILSSVCVLWPELRRTSYRSVPELDSGTTRNAKGKRARIFIWIYAWSRVNVRWVSYDIKIRVGNSRRRERSDLLRRIQVLWVKCPKNQAKRARVADTELAFLRNQTAKHFIHSLRLDDSLAERIVLHARRNSMAAKKNPMRQCHAYVTTTHALGCSHMEIERDSRFA